MVVEFRGRGENGHFLTLCWFLKAIGEELCYHTRGSRTAFQIRWTRKSGTAFECLPIAIVFGFANGFALCANDDYRFCRICILRHFQNAIVSIVLSRQFDVEEISIRKSANRFRYDNNILREARHHFPPGNVGIGTYSHMFVNSREILVSRGFQLIDRFKPASFVA